MKAQYKALLTACDLPRRNDLDGRGNLSEEALAEFTRFFLETCIDQVKFMEELVAPDKLRARIFAWANEEIKTKTTAAAIAHHPGTTVVPGRACA